METKLKQHPVDKELIKSIADSLADELAKKMYSKLLMLKVLPEIQAIEKGKIKPLKGKEIVKFLTKQAN